MTKTSENLIECRGWKEICEFLGVSKPTAKKILKARGLLVREFGRPVLNVEAYNRSSQSNHKDPPK